MKKGIGFWHPANLLATVFGVGLIPFAPGTWGSLAGIPLAFVVSAPLALIDASKIWFAAFALELILLYFVGYFAIKKYQKETQTQDASEIVYDEALAQILTYYFIKCAVTFWLTLNFNMTTGIIVPFIFFRLFDIFKPWPISIIDRKYKNAHGVMLDDVLASVYAAVCAVLVFMVIDSYFRF